MRTSTEWQTARKGRINANTARQHRLPAAVPDPVADGPAACINGKDPLTAEKIFRRIEPGFDRLYANTVTAKLRSRMRRGPMSSMNGAKANRLSNLVRAH